MRRLAALLIVGTAVFASADPAAAARAPKAQAAAASIRLDQPDPRLGSSATFTVTYDAKQVKDPRVAVRCYQDGGLVYGEAAPSGTAFVLGGSWSMWRSTGGAASCTAELFHYIWNGAQAQQYESLATTSFEAAG